jgi:hypothetical protein
MWKNMVEKGRSHMTKWRVHIARWIPKAKNTHSQYIIPVAFPLQQWLHERASMLLPTYIAYLVETDRNRFLARARIVSFLTRLSLYFRANNQQMI